MKDKVCIYSICVAGMTEDGISYKTEGIPHLTDLTKSKLSQLANKIVNLEEVHSKIRPVHIIKGTPIFEISWGNQSLIFNCEHDVVENLFGEEIGSLCDLVMADMVEGMKKR